MINRLFRWFFRLGSLCIVAGVIAVLPRVMPGIPWWQRLLWSGCLWFAMNIASLTTLATLIPRTSNMVDDRAQRIAAKRNEPHHHAK